MKYSLIEEIAETFVDKLEARCYSNVEVINDSFSFYVHGVAGPLGAYEKVKLDISKLNEDPKKIFKSWKENATRLVYWD